MTRVLLIGIAPKAVDTPDPDVPPGTTQEKIAAGFAATLSDKRSRGSEEGFCSVLPDENACAVTRD